MRKHVRLAVPLTFCLQAVIPISFYPAPGMTAICGREVGGDCWPGDLYLRVRVFYHDKCFDGAASAALFSRFYRERIREDANFVFSGLLHRAGSLFNESDFTGDENAIVDFKYSSSPKITWWFDHHESAFLSPADAAHFEQDQSNRKFYDPAFKSCTSFIAMIAEQCFGFDPSPVAELVHWTDIVDGAMCEDARAAVEMKAPAMKLTMAIEAMREPDFVKQLIP